MDAPPEFKASDIIVVPGFFAAFQTAPGEAPSYGGHIAGFLSPLYVLHALWRVVTQAWGSFAREHPKGFQVWRKLDLSDDERRAVAAKASEYSARGYGWWRLIFHGADYALGWVAHYLWGGKGEVYLARRLLSDQTRWPLCHEVWARAYKEVLGYEFGREWAEVTPDTMNDHMKAHPGEWTMVYEARSAPG